MDFSIPDTVRTGFIMQQRIASLLLIFISSIAASAAIACEPSWATADLTKTDRTFEQWSANENARLGLGRRLDEEIYYWHRGTWFTLPTGYINPWRQHRSDSVPALSEYIENLGQYSQWTGYNPATGSFSASLLQKNELNSPTFSFWTPSLRYVEQDMEVYRNYRPCEAGRRVPSQEEYVVQFRLLWVDISTASNSTTFSRFVSESHSSVQNSDLLLIDDGAVYLELRCTANRSCSGWYWDKTKDIAIFVRIPEELRQSDPIEFWKTPIAGAVILVDDWRLKEGENHVD